MKQPYHFKHIFISFIIGIEFAIGLAGEKFEAGVGSRAFKN
jgi:hypothetical protein